MVLVCGISGGVFGLFAAFCIDHKNLTFKQWIKTIIGFVFIAIILSIPLGLSSAKNLAPNYFIFIIAKIIIIFFRAIPEFILAMILVIAVGFGAIPGVLALGLHTMGFLAKFYAEDIEHINKGPIDALKSSGATKLQIILLALPQES